MSRKMCKYVWMSQARAKPTGLGIECEGKELSKEQLPPFEETKIKIFPAVSIHPNSSPLDTFWN